MNKLNFSFIFCFFLFVDFSVAWSATHVLQQLLARATRPENLDDTRIEDLIGAFLGPTQTLEILPENELHLALHSFVEKDEKSAIAEYVPSC